MSIEIEGFRFSNDLFYQDETYVPFRPGITLLRGINYDAGPSESNSNGTGKTRIPQLLSSFLFNDCDRGNLKKMVLPTFKGSVDFMNKATKEKWMFAADVKENAWEILKNGEVPVDKDGNPFSFHKFSECQKLLTKEIQMSYKEWSNFVHINRHSISTLLQGKPDEKRKFLESFFNIDDFYKEKLEEYKALKTAQEKEIERLEQDRARYGQVLESLSTLDGKIYLAIQIETSKDAQHLLWSEQTSLTTRSSALKTDLSYWRDYYEYMQKAEGKRPLNVLKSTLQSHQVTLADVLQAEKTQQTVRNKANTFESLKQVEEPAVPTVEDPLPDTILESEKLLLQMKEKQKLRDRYVFVKKQIPQLSLTISKEEAEVELKDLLAKQADVRLHQSLVKDGNNCTRCGQSIDFVLKQEDPAVRHKTLQEEGKTIEERLNLLHSHSTKLGQKKNLEEQLEAIKAEAEKFPVFTETMDQVSLKVEELKKNQKTWETYRALKKDYDAKTHAREVLLAELTALGYPGILTEDHTGRKTALNRTIDELQLDIDIMQKAATLLDRVASLKPQTELQAELFEVEEDLQDLNARIQKLNECHGEFKAQLALANELHRAKDELAEELKAGENLYNEYRILQSLVKFFSPAGFKVYELRKRCELLIEKANYWSPIFFSEQYEWSLPEDIDSLEFLVQPIAHRKTAPYPASALSAGEENRGERVLLFSQLELAPKNRSLNVLFLDEIEGHLDPVGRTVFTEIVIPKLKSTFPLKSIIIISHEESLRESPHIDHLWLAERRNRKTTLKVFENFNLTH